MLEIIQSIFESYQFSNKELKNGYFYIPNKDKKTEEYWLVIKAEVANLLELQDTLFQNCKSLCSDVSVDKNLSMLILWETDGSIPTETLKEKIIRIEEDPYLFKKYVLYFSNKESMEFKKEIANSKITTFVKEKIVSREVFDKYKENPYVQSWQSLLYRIAIKIPFLSIVIGESKGLQSLFEANAKAIETNDSTNFDRELMLGIDNLLSKGIKKMTAQELLNQLLPSMGENTSGN